MIYEFRLPDIGEGTVEGEIVKWHVKAGDTIKADQPLVEVMTDKATVVIPSPYDGVILKTVGVEGETVKVGAVLVEIETLGEKADSAVGRERKIENEPPASRQNNILATPAVRRLARDKGIDITKITGSGPGGRITVEDIENFQVEPAEGAGGMIKPAAAFPRRNQEKIALHGLRRRIADKMTLSKRNIPHFTYVDEIDCTDLVALRNELKIVAEERKIVLTYIPFIIKALIPAFKLFPLVNAHFNEENSEISVHRDYNIGISVDTQDGLMVVVIKDAGTKDIFELATELRDLSERARSKKISVEELQGSTFTITNVGNIGGLFATPIINPPETAILGVNRIHKRPVVRNGGIEIRDMMYMTITLDHRVIDGADGARFLNEVKRHLENPSTLL